MEVDKAAVPDSSADTHLQPEPSAAPASNGACNGEVTESKQGGEDADISSSNGSATPVKGKAKGKSSYC